MSSKIMRYITVALLVSYAITAWADQYQTYAQKVPEQHIKQPDQKALKQQLKLIKNNPYGKTLILRHLANLSLINGDKQKAIHYLQQAIDLNALAPAAIQEMQSHLAQLYAEMGEQQKVVTTLQPILDSGVAADQIAANTWLALGNAQAQLGHWEKAANSLKKARKAGGKGEGLQQLQIAVAIKMGHYSAAIKSLQTLIDAHPNRTDYLIQLAAIYSKQGKDDRAVAALRIAKRRGALTTSARQLQLVSAYQASGLPYYAARQLENGMQRGLIPSTPQNQYLLAALWIEAKENQQAISPLRKVAQATQKSSYYAQLGKLYMEQAQWLKAIQAYQNAMNGLGSRSHAGNIQLSMGLAYYQLNRPSAATKAFQQAEQIAATASLASQWLKYLKAKPAGIQAPRILPPQSTQPIALSLAKVTPHVTQGAARSELPASVPPTSDRYTPVGAVFAGNDKGVPPWTGGITPQRAPASFKSGGTLINPYADEKPLFTITNDNLEEYQSMLSPGFIELFKQNSGFTMPVYPTHRSAAFPTEVYQATLKNQGRARLKNPDALVGATQGFPFRQPKTGAQAMWNHRLRYRGTEIKSRTDEAIVSAQGIEHMQQRVTKVLFGYGNPDKPESMGRNVLAYYMMYPLQNGRRKHIVLVHETMDNTVNPRSIWVASTKFGRVVRLPPVGYDFPRPGTDDLMYVDQIDMYNGAYDHYVWRLIGRRTMIVPYNAYKLQSKQLSYETLLQPHYPARAPMRYERHRVWIIEATTRQGNSNMFPKRTFYLDEDSWSILMVDCYDQNGNLWRFQVGHPVERYDQQLVSIGPVFIYDFKSGRYLATRLSNETFGSEYNNINYTASQFRPANLRSMLN